MMRATDSPEPGPQQPPRWGMAKALHNKAVEAGSNSEGLSSIMIDRAQSPKKKSSWLQTMKQKWQRSKPKANIAVAVKKNPSQQPGKQNPQDCQNRSRLILPECDNGTKGWQSSTNPQHLKVGHSSQQVLVSRSASSDYDGRKPKVRGRYDPDFESLLCAANPQHDLAHEAWLENRQGQLPGLRDVALHSVSPKGRKQKRPKPFLLRMARLFGLGVESGGESDDEGLAAPYTALKSDRMAGASKAQQVPDFQLDPEVASSCWESCCTGRSIKTKRAHSSQ